MKMGAGEPSIIPQFLEGILTPCYRCYRCYRYQGNPPGGGYPRPGGDGRLDPSSRTCGPSWEGSAIFGIPSPWVRTRRVPACRQKSAETRLRASSLKGHPSSMWKGHLTNLDHTVREPLPASPLGWELLLLPLTCLAVPSTVL